MKGKEEVYKTFSLPGPESAQTRSPFPALILVLWLLCRSEGLLPPRMSEATEESRGRHLSEDSPALASGSSPGSPHFGQVSATPQ